jgi:hypothetical protein
MKYVALVHTRSTQGTEENFVQSFGRKVKERDDLEDLNLGGLNLKGLDGRWWAVVNFVMNFRVSENADNFFTRTVSLFSAPFS